MRDPLNWLFLALLIAVLTIALLAVFTGAEALEVPKDATPLGVQPLPCGAYLQFYDGNGNPEDGAEWVALVVQGEDTPRAVVEYHTGERGTFKSAEVVIPGETPVAYTTVESFMAAYSGPCAIAVREGKLRT